MSNIQITNCCSVNEFWEALTPPKMLPEHTIYRGHGDAEWVLLASIHRVKDVDGLIGSKIESFRIPEEHRAMLDFITFCDQARLPIPGDSQVMRKMLKDMCGIITATNQPEKWPLNEFYALIALMQHFDFPTCFLDWTRSPYIAAFFAASEALLNDEIQKNVDEKQIAIWTLDVGNPLLSSTEQFEFVEIPPNNRNVYAQSGVFTVLRSGTKYGTTYAPMSLDKFVDEMDEYGSKPILRKITVTANFAKDIIEICNRYSINFATVFPDYTGVSKQLKFQRKINKTSLQEKLKG